LQHDGTKAGKAALSLLLARLLFPSFFAQSSGVGWLTIGVSDGDWLGVGDGVSASFGSLGVDDGVWVGVRLGVGVGVRVGEGVGVYVGVSVWLAVGVRVALEVGSASFGSLGLCDGV